MSEHMGFTSAAVHPDTIVTTMSGGEKQGVAITRALHFDAQLVILDEPTMGPSPTETKKTLEFVTGIKRAGKSAIFIDHNIFHVYPVVDRLYVLDRGKVAGVYDNPTSRWTTSSTGFTAWRGRARWSSHGNRNRQSDARHARYGQADEQSDRAALDAPPLRQPARHHRRRAGDVDRLHHRRANGLY